MTTSRMAPVAPTLFMKWLSATNSHRRVTDMNLTRAYSVDYDTKEFGVALNSDLFPLVEVYGGGKLVLRAVQKCESEWITPALLVKHDETVGLGSREGYIFVQLSEPVPEDSSESPRAGSGNVLGFVMDSAALYDVHGKTRIKGKIPSVKKVVNVESSKKNKYWEVLIYEDNTLSCNCPAWRFKGRNCKHVQKVCMDEPSL